MSKNRLFMLILVVIGSINTFAQTSVGTLADLRTALQDTSVSQIQLTADIEGVTDELYLQIARENFIFDGAGHTITGCVTGYTASGVVSSHHNTLDVIANGVTVKNVTLINTGTGTNGKPALNAMTVWHASNVVLENVKLINSGGGGLQVVGATVTANGLQTSGNTWYGVGISSSTGTGAVSSSFTIDEASVFGEALPVTAESANQIIFPANSRWGTVLATTTVGGVSVTGVVATNNAEWDNDKLLAKISTAEELEKFLEPTTQTSFNGLLLAAGEYNLTKTISLTKDIIIKGSGKDVTILKAPSAVRYLVQMHAGAIKNLSLMGYAANNDGPNQNQFGIQMLDGTAVVDSLNVQNFRSGISVDATPSIPLTMSITNSVIDRNRTGIILTCKGSTLDATITNNTITNNRTFGILLNSTSANWAGATLNITRNIIHDNWFGEFETRVIQPFDISGNYWGPTGPVVYNTFANETPSPVDGGTALTTKPDHYSNGEIYQPINATGKGLTNFTAGKLTVNTYYKDEALTQLANYAPMDTTVIGGSEDLEDELIRAINTDTGNDAVQIVISTNGTTDTTIVQLSEAIQINKNVTISSADSTKVITIVTSNGQPAFAVAQNASLKLNNISLIDRPDAQGQEAPIITVAEGANVIINNSIISGYIGEQPLIDSEGTIILSNVNFKGIAPISTIVTRSAVTRASATHAFISTGDGEATIDRITFSDNQLEGYSFIAGTKISISNSLFNNNGNMKLMTINEGSDISLINNTFINSTTISPVEIITYNGGTADIVNNILFTGAAEAINGSGSGLTTNYNALKTAANPIANNIILGSFAEIKFVNSTDLRLRSDSPLVGKGNPNAVVGDKDIAGNNRTTNLKVNIGAYESVYIVSSGEEGGQGEEEQEIPELSLLSQTEAATTIGWIQIVKTDHYKLEIFESIRKYNLLRELEYDRDNHANGDDILFDITQLDTSRSYYIEVIAYDIEGNAIATKGIVIPAITPTGIQQISGNINVYSNENRIYVETDMSTEVSIIRINGASVYKGIINGSQAISVSSGIYIIKLKIGRNMEARKIIVY